MVIDAADIEDSVAHVVHIVCTDILQIIVLWSSISDYCASAYSFPLYVCHSGEICYRLLLAGCEEQSRHQAQ